MKTLDEVIEKIEKMWVCPSSDEAAEYCDFMEVKEDAINYLKHLQEYYEMSRTPEDLNPPLTWDELKGMKEKPVWVEDNIDEPEDLTKYWAIYRRIEKAQETEYALLSDLFYDKAEYGKSWQAYRKERK